MVAEVFKIFNEPVSSMTFAELVENTFIDIINILVPLIIAVIFAVLVWKLVDMFIINAGDQQARTNGKRTVVIATVSLVVVLSIWGILNLLINSVFGS